jgi:hypothetical protein
MTLHPAMGSKGAFFITQCSGKTSGAAAGKKAVPSSAGKTGVPLLSYTGKTYPKVGKTL